MASHNDLGKEGEDVAVAFLQDKGYVVLERNWVFQKAEIDIIAQKSDKLIVVEVKTRTSAVFGDPQNFVNPKKIQLLLKAVNEYVSLKNIENSIRFDIIAITKDATNLQIEHLEDAFYYF
ncbi:YraN family protein [Flavobacterium sp.]|uniref:YraN family protein n=1 Tax=Flavobacterium sp. TaxID=239 RepID=UPI0028BE6A17|nr:YraN family protein [Flavobacterium sp.]